MRSIPGQRPGRAGRGEEKKQRWSERTRTVCYGKWSFIVDLPSENADLMVTNGDWPSVDKIASENSHV